MKNKFNVENIVYFCDSYYLMIDYDQTLEEIVGDFLNSESSKRVNDTLNEIKNILEHKDDKILEYILEKSIVISTTKEDLFVMINEINDEFQKVIRK